MILCAERLVCRSAPLSLHDTSPTGGDHERRGRKPQEYAYISRSSDEAFRQPNKQKNLRVSWRTNKNADIIGENNYVKEC